MLNTLNAVACKVLDYMTALLFCLIAVVLAIGGFVGTFAAAMYFTPNSTEQLVGVVVCILVMWSSLLAMRPIEMLDL